MTEEPGKTETFEDLRRRAEEIVGQREKDEDVRMSSEEFLRLLHEIEVYQVEVEIQNEELRRTARELRASRDQYQDLFDAAPVGFVVLDGKGRIRQANAAAAGMFGEDAAWLKGRLLSERIYAPDQRAYFSWFRQMADRGEVTDGPDLRVQGGGGTSTMSA
jgi:PAS domain S-box-containing protein